MPAIDLKMLGPCGIYCGSCDIRVACTTGNREAQQEIADWINKRYNADCAAAEIRCGGCHGPLDVHWSVDCRILKCAKARKIVTCAECAEYESCPTLQGFYRSGDYKKARATLERIREIGLDEWLREQERSA